MEKNLALESLVNITNSNLGYVPSTPSEFSELSRSIQKKTCRTISLSSIKRIWGYVKYEGFPSVTTLNTLAQYNGYKDWEAFLIGNTAKYGEDSGFLDESVVNQSNLNIGDKLLLRWDNEKACEIEYIEDGRFRVNRSQNIKLKEGDTFTLHTLCVGHPIYVSDIQRGDQRFPGYIGAKKGGVTTIIRCVDK
ncbi:MAG: hypothetical protein K2M12_09370 [Muribaculaceae bacterium]|nr:hypothetical protein [Muribaculaceae bacterium]